MIDGFCELGYYTALPVLTVIFYIAKNKHKKLTQMITGKHNTPESLKKDKGKLTISHLLWRDEWQTFNIEQWL